MASAWSTSWGTSWLNSWGAGTPPPVVIEIIGGDDAPQSRRKRRKRFHDVVQELERTIHELLQPPVPVESARPAPAITTEAARSAVNELLVLAQGQHALLVQAARLRQELQQAIDARNRIRDAELDDEEALIWMC